LELPSFDVIKDVGIENNRSNRESFLEQSLDSNENKAENLEEIKP